MSLRGLPPGDDYSIEVVCDSDRHARGKVAKIASYVYIEGHWRKWAGGRSQQMRRRVNRLKARGIKPEPFDLFFAGPADLRLRCKLCGQHVPEPSEAVLNRLAAQGRSPITLNDLRSASI